MKYAIYTSEGKRAAEVEGDSLQGNSNVAYVIKAGKTVAIVSYESGAIIVLES